MTNPVLNAKVQTFWFEKVSIFEIIIDVCIEQQYGVYEKKKKRLLYKFYKKIKKKEFFKSIQMIE